MELGKYLDKARVALRKRNADQAIALYRQVLRAAPDHGEAQQGLLGAFARKAELRGGPNLLDKTAAKGLAATARGLVSAGQAGAAVKTCETGLERHPLDAGLAALLAQALETLGRPEAALATWSYRLELDDSDFAALKAAGMLHYRLGRIEEATACLDRAHELDRHDADVGRLRKNLAAEGTLAATRFTTAESSHQLAKSTAREAAAERRGRPRDAAEAVDELGGLEQAHADAPRDRSALRALVEALIRARRFDRAEKLLDGAGERLGGTGKAPDGVGKAPDGAAEAPDGAGKAPDGAGKVPDGAGKVPDEAGQGGHRASPSAGDEVFLGELRGDVRLAANEHGVRAARSAGDRAELKRLGDERARIEVDVLGPRLARDPTQAALRLRVARAHYRLGEVDPAIEHFQALVGDPRHELDARQGLGACFLRKKLYPLASRQLEAALERAGGVGTDRGKEICYHLGLVAERLGDTSAALTRYLAVYEVDIAFKDVASKVEQLGE